MHVTLIVRVIYSDNDVGRVCTVIEKFIKGGGNKKKKKKTL